MIIRFNQNLREFKNRNAIPDLPEDITGSRQIPLKYGWFPAYSG
jgi:hypothetical protein